MRYFTLIAVVATALAGAPAMARPQPSGEQDLARMLAGRVAGQATHCIPLHEAENLTVIDGTAIVYNDGPIVYVNRPDGAASLVSDQILVTRPSTSELCQLDKVDLRSPSDHTFVGYVVLGDFVPYTRAH